MLRPTLALALLAAALLPPVQAQTPTRVRQGGWLEVGTGTGGVWIGCGGCTTPFVAFGQSLYARGGGAVSERVLWGVEAMHLPRSRGGPQRIDGEIRRDSTLRVQSVGAGPVLLWYPWRSGIFVKGGLGVAHSRVQLQLPGSSEVVSGRGTASTLSFGVGLDVPLLRRVAITAHLGTTIGAVGDIEGTSATVDDVITTLYNANIALTLR